MAILSKLGKYSNLGLLILRIGVGAMMILHGYPKIIGGPEKWTKLGNNMSYIGIKVYPEIWGFLAAVSEGVGGLFFILGLFFRPSCFFLFFTMLIAALMHLGDDGIKSASHAIELGSLFLGMLFVGPGRYSIDKG